jgi:hypothetical protein
MRVSFLALALAAGVPAGVEGQTLCKPSKSSHEADLFAHFSVPLAFSTAQGPNLARPGTVFLSLEGTYLPKIDDATATPTTCRPGKGPENTDLLFAFPRPRVGFALPDGVLLEVSWVPPVRINGVRPNLWAFSLGRSVSIHQRGSAMLMGRLHAEFGSILAPITCPKESLSDPASECFQGKRKSDDRFKPIIFGAELGLGWAMAGGRFRPYLGTGYNILHPRFRVNAVYSDGTVDHQRVEVNLARVVLMGGATWAPSAFFSVSGEIYTAPADAVTGRVRLSYAIKHPR